ARAAEAKLEGDATEDQTEEQKEHRQVEDAKKYRIRLREGGEEGGTGHDEPRLVAIPERRDRVHHLHAQVLILGPAEEDADAEIEAVEYGVHQDREGDDRGPEQREGARFHGHAPALTLPPVAVSASSANANGRLPRAAGIGFTSTIGPCLSSFQM